MGAKDTEGGGRNREIINNIYSDFWQDKFHFKGVIPMYIEITDDIMTPEHSIVYNNMRCRNVAKEFIEKIDSGLNKRGKIRTYGTEFWR